MGSARRRLPLRGELRRIFPNGTIARAPLSFADHAGGGTYNEGLRFLSLRSLDVAYVYWQRYAALAGGAEAVAEAVAEGTAPPPP